MIMEKKKPGEVAEMPDESLLSAAEDLIAAVHSKDAKAVMDALSAAYSMMDCAEESVETLEGPGE